MRYGPLAQQVELRLAVAKRRKVLSVRGRVDSLTGCTAEELTSGTVDLLDRFHADDRARAERIFSGKEPEQGENTLRLRHADGGVVCVAARWRRESAADGEPVVALTLTDAKGLTWTVAERRRALDTGLVIDCVEESLHFKDLHHVVTLANRQFRQMVTPAGKAPRDVIGLTDYDLFAAAAADGFFELERQVLEGAASAHAVLEIEGADGGREWLDVRKVPIRNGQGELFSILTVMAVITEGVLSQHMLEASEASLKAAQRLAHVGNYELNLKTGFWTASEALAEVLGLKPGEKRPIDDWLKLIHADDRVVLEKEIAQLLAEPGGLFDREYRIYRHNDGQLRWVHSLARAEFDDTGEAVAMHGTLQDVTERKTAEAELRSSNNLLQMFIEHAPAALAMFDREMRYLAVSQRWLDVYHLKREAVLGHLHYKVFPDLPERWKAVHQRGMAGEGIRNDEDHFDRADGTVQWLKWEILPWQGQDGAVGGIVLFVEDITEQKKTEERLHLSASVFTHASEGILITDATGTILEVNAAFTRMTGYARRELIGRNPRMLKSGLQSQDFYAEMWRHLREEGHWSGEIWNRAKDGHIIAELITISTIPGADGKPKQYVALCSDITSFKEQEKQLQRITHYDLLTGLPNRALLGDRLHQAMAQAHRSGHAVAIVNLDLDDFRAVNDEHGHTVGDQLLLEMTRRMHAALREGDTLARVGGDELVAVLLDQRNAEETEILVERLLHAVAEPVEMGGLTVKVSASAGVTVYPQADDVDADQLLRQADQAMYQAKLAGKGRQHLFDPALDRSVRGHLEELGRVRQALETGELLLHFQPKVNMRTGAVVGVEALIRWQHPTRGLLMPGQFLPIADGNPLMVELGDWVLRTALNQCEAWRKMGLDLPVSVNVDALQLQQPDFTEKLEALLAQHSRLGPGRLELEVLETSALEDIARVSRVMQGCGRLGVRFALDDFGTGYSSLSYLKWLPIPVLKIDRTFVRDMLVDPEDLTLLEGVLGLATAFRREAIAEGVETLEHGLMLLRLGCELGQGYGISPPLPPEAVPGWVARWQPDARWTAATPVGPGSFPLLHAMVEVRAWVEEVEEYVCGHALAAPDVDQHHCEFGAWLDAETAARRGADGGLRQLNTQHERLHALGHALVEAKALGDAGKAEDGLTALRNLRDELLEMLQLVAGTTA